MTIAGSQLAQRQTSHMRNLRACFSHKTYLSLSTRQRRICLQIFKDKGVCVSYTGLKQPAQAHRVLKDKHRHMQLLLSISLHQPISETYPSSMTCLSLSMMCLCFLNFTEMAIIGSQLAYNKHLQRKFTCIFLIRRICLYRQGKDGYVFRYSKSNVSVFPILS